MHGTGILQSLPDAGTPFSVKAACLPTVLEGKLGHIISLIDAATAAPVSFADQILFLDRIRMECHVRLHAAYEAERAREED